MDAPTIQTLAPAGLRYCSCPRQERSVHHTGHARNCLFNGPSHSAISHERSPRLQTSKTSKAQLEVLHQKTTRTHQNSRVPGPGPGLSIRLVGLPSADSNVEENGKNLNLLKRVLVRRE